MPSATLSLKSVLPFSKNRPRDQGCNAAAVVLFCYNYKAYDEHNEVNLIDCIHLTATMLSTSYKPSKKCVLVLDNAGYHHRHEEDYVKALGSYT